MVAEVTAPDGPQERLSAELVRLKREHYVRGANVTEAFVPPEDGRIVHVEWDDEVAIVTWLVPAVVTDGWVT